MGSSYVAVNASSRCVVNTMYAAASGGVVIPVDRYRQLDVGTINLSTYLDTGLKYCSQE